MKFEKNMHHIIPRSRTKKGDNPNRAENKVEVKKHLHDKYHSLFSNKTPDEILSFLEDYFWGGNRCFIEDYLKKRMHLEAFNELFGK